MKKLGLILKNKFVNFFKTNNGSFTVHRLLIIITLINAALELGLCSVHNNAVYKVYQTVAVYSFFFFIILLLSFVNALRLKEHPKYYIYSFIFLPATIALGIIYIYLLLTDVYYIGAINGTLHNGATIAYAIEDSAILMGVGVALAVISLALTITEKILDHKNHIIIGVKHE